MDTGFSPDLEYAIVKRHGIAREQLPELYEQLKQWGQHIPRMPDLALLREEHARAVIEITDYTADLDSDWPSFLHRIRQKEEVERDAQNPYLPRWDGKTDDRPTMWAEEALGISDSAKTNLMNIFRESSPPMDTHIATILQRPIIPELDVLASVLESIKRFLPFFVKPMGDDISFRWSKALCTMAGLGIPAFRYLASELAKDEDDWGYFAECSDDELVKELTNARWITGYPFALVRADFKRLHEAIAGETLTRAPHWWGTSLILHIIRHTRYYRSYNGRPHIFVAYRGRSAMLPMNDDGSNLPLNAMTNQASLKTLCDMLHVPKASPQAKKKSPLEIKAASIFNFITPTMLTRPLDLRTHTEMIYPARVSKSMLVESKEYKWIDPGITICDTATIDVKSGEVQADVHVNGPYALSMAWPHGEMDPEDLLNWQCNLPPLVVSMRPSQILRRVIKNINDLGEPEGFDAIIDGIMTANMMRLDLAGSLIGNVIRNEFPLVWSLPMTAGIDDTTNQGKTNTARILGGALLPSIRVVQASRTISAPAQRAVASPLEEGGTAIYDEFVMPGNHEHFLSQSGLQMLATGGTVTPGRAMENSTGIRLKLPLFLVAKICTATPDIRNRSFPIFLDTLNETNKSTKAELALIMSGQAALVMRLCMMRYIHENNLVEKARGLSLSESDNRFNAHMAICELFGRREAIDRYMKKANKQFEQQYAAAGESGLADDIGIETGFNVGWYYQRCDRMVLEQIESLCKADPMSIETFTRYVVEDRNVRSFERVATQYRMREDRLLRQVRQELKQHIPVRTGWKLKYVPKDVSNVWDKSRHRMDYILLVRDEPAPVEQIPAVEKQA